MTRKPTRDLVKRLQEGKRKARKRREAERPKRIDEITTRMNELEAQRKALPVGERLPVYKELRELGHELSDLMYPNSPKEAS